MLLAELSKVEKFVFRDTNVDYPSPILEISHWGRLPFDILSVHIIRRGVFWTRYRSFSPISVMSDPGESEYQPSLSKAWTNGKAQAS